MIETLLNKVGSVNPVEQNAEMQCLAYVIFGWKLSHSWANSLHD
jgi:hypothetical protein